MFKQQECKQHKREQGRPNECKALQSYSNGGRECPPVLS